MAKRVLTEEQREKNRQYQKEWYKRNRDKKLAQSRTWHAANKESVAERKHRTYFADHELHLQRNRDARARRLDKESEYRKAYYQAHKEEILRKNAEYLLAHPEINLKKAKSYRQTHPEYVTKWNHIRQSKIRQTSIGPVDYKAIIERANGMCELCLKPLGESKMEFDHWVPLSPKKGQPKGTHTQDNLRLAHAQCNRKKQNMQPDEWIRFSSSLSLQMEAKVS